MRTDVSTPKELGDLRRELLDAGMRVLREHGPLHLTLRRVAEEAGTSTMGIYTCFGGRAGLLEEIYRYGFDALRDRLTADLDGPQEAFDRIMAVAFGYREFALADPALYSLMFERPLPDFDPSPELRRDTLGQTFSLLAAATSAEGTIRLVPSGDPLRMAYLVWATIHGIVSIELTHALRAPMPGWFLNSPEQGRQILADGLTALLSGLQKTP